MTDQPIEPHALNVALLHALGLDPETISGCRLTIQGGAFPQLEVWHLPPNRDGELTDGWVAPLAETAADATFVMLPGADREAPPATAHTYPPPVDDTAALNVELAQTLDLLADVANGAYVDNDLRDQLTRMARRHASMAIAAAFPQPQPPLDRRVTVKIEDNPPTPEGTTP